MVWRLLIGGGALIMLWSACPLAGTTLVVQHRTERPDAIVALASHEWERLPALARMAARYPDAAILLTVPPTPTQHNCFDCAERVDWLALLGIERNRITELGIRARGTWGEAETVAAYCRHHEVRSLLVVTSPYHTRRSLMTFRHILEDTGIAVGIHPALAESGARPREWWKYPYDRDYVAYEWTALAYYSVRIVADTFNSAWSSVAA